MKYMDWLHPQPTDYLPRRENGQAVSSFSPQEYECLKGALGLLSVNRTLDLEKAMRMFKVQAVNLPM